MERNRNELLESMVLSASGWRAVFGGTDDALTPSINPGYRDLVIVAADTFAETLEKQVTTRSPIIVVGSDTRPTGPAIADTAIRTFLARGCSVRWLGVSAAPELMSYTKTTEECDGFFYISASHNPPGHNGLKLGFSDGAVLPASAAYPLIEEFRRRASNDPLVTRLRTAVEAVPKQKLDQVFAKREHYKRAALDAYRTFAIRVGNGPGSSAPDQLLVDLRRALSDRPLGVVAELNGSARSVSIDRTFLPELGLRLALYNDRPGEFSHQILPEGTGLDEAAQLLDRHNSLDPAFQIAYVPDNDGDRGNLVFHDPQRGGVPLDAQSVFALVVTVELAWMRHLGLRSDRVAVVANGPTSLRVDRICEYFAAQLFRAEVGEANAVTRAGELAEEGWVVPILGEGSNGGNITPPATVRDPMSTLLALVKLHAFDLAAYWQPEGAGTKSASPFLSLVEHLPEYQTVASDDPRAKMHVGEIPHSELKNRYEEALPHRIPVIIEALAAHFGGAFTYRIINYEGTRAIDGPANRSGPERGGHRVVFSDASGIDRAAVWMRGSGTEPIFRVLADCEGADADLLDLLISWQREGVALAAGINSDP